MNEMRRIAEVKVGQRHRKDMGDIDKLARSIADVGLLHPIVVRGDGALIAGARRLAACRLLEWTDIPVTVVDLTEIVQGEFAENANRKNFLPSEIEAIRRAMEPMEKAAAKGRMSQGGKRAKVSQPSRTADKIGALAGVSGRTVEKIAAVVAAAEAEPEKFGRLVEEMDKTGKVDRAHQQLKIERQRQVHAARAERAGRVDDLHALADSGQRFGAIMADPGWDFLTRSQNGEDRSAGRHYTTTAFDEIKALPVKRLAAEDAILFLWIVDWFPPRLVLELVEAWGFEHKTTAFTWAKTSPDGEGWHFGQGYWTRANPEICWLCTRGHPRRLSADVLQLIIAPVGEHSAKPEETRNRIERLSCGPYLELYARHERPGWVTWGNEVPPPQIAPQNSPSPKSKADEIAHEWDLFVLFLAKTCGWHPVAASDHVQWLQRRPFYDVDDWLRDDAWRRSQRRKSIPEQTKMAWHLWAAEREAMSVEQINAELDAIADDLRCLMREATIGGAMRRKGSSGTFRDTPPFA
jgi:ParB/RepB/Spo0J family partition protein